MLSSKSRSSPYRSVNDWFGLVQRRGALSADGVFCQFAARSCSANTVGSTLKWYPKTAICASVMLSTTYTLHRRAGEIGSGFSRWSLSSCWVSNSQVVVPDPESSIMRIRQLRFHFSSSFWMFIRYGYLLYMSRRKAPYQFASGEALGI